MIIEEINRLESRQHELKKIMRGSDAHALGCDKTDVKFSEKYSSEVPAYKEANAEFNENEKKIAELQQQFAAEQEAMAAREEVMPEA